MAGISNEERARRKAAEAGDDAFTVSPTNPRIPVSPVHPDAPEPITPAATALPVGTPGTVDPLPPEEVERVRREAAKIPTFPVRILRGYFPKDGGEKLEPSDEAVELPIAEARYLIESGIAERADPLP